MPETRLVLSDTNLFFECKALEDLPWSELGGDPLYILLSKPVLDEIDKHKKGRGRTRKRAIEIFKRIRAMLKAKVDEEIIQESGPLVVLKLARNLSVSTRHGALLDLNKTDDRLVAILSTLMDDGKDALLLTHDTGPASTAHTLGLPFNIIPEDWLLEAPPKDKETQELERQVAAYAAQEPILKLTLASHAEPESKKSKKSKVRHTVETFAPLDDADLDAEVARLKAAHPPQTDFSKSPSSYSKPKFGPFTKRDNITFEPPSEEAQRIYLDETYPAWLQSCREQLACLHATKQKSPPLHLRIELENDGSRSADNLRIEFSADGNAQLFWSRQCDENDKTETEPDYKGDTQQSVDPLPLPPVPPAWKEIVVPSEKSSLSGLARLVEQTRRPMQGTSGLSISFPTPRNPMDIPIPDMPLPRDPETFYFFDCPDGVPVKKCVLTCDRMRHQSGVEVFEFDVLFGDLSTPNASILCTVHADNLTTPVSLRVRVEQIVTSSKPMALLEKLVASVGGG